MTTSKFRQFFLFCCSGGLALCVDFAVLYAFVTWLHMPHWLARCFSFVAAATFTWQFNMRISFRGHAPRFAGFTGWVSYMGSALIGGSINYAAYIGAMALMDSTNPSSLFLGVAAGSLAGLGANYFLCSAWFFKAKK